MIKSVGFPFRHTDISLLGGILKSEGIEYKELSGIAPNPTVASVREGIKIIREHKLDFILGVGGGSTVDAAKAIALGAHSEVDIWEHFVRATEKVIKEQDKESIKVPDDKIVPMGCILTLAATGSEMNIATVISNRETKYVQFSSKFMDQTIFYQGKNGLSGT